MAIPRSFFPSNTTPEQITIAGGDSHTATVLAWRDGTKYVMEGSLPEWVGLDRAVTVNGIPVVTISVWRNPATTALEVHPGGMDPTPEIVAEWRRITGR